LALIKDCREEKINPDELIALYTILAEDGGLSPALSTIIAVSYPPQVSYHFDMTYVTRALENYCGHRRSRGSIEALCMSATDFAKDKCAADYAEYHMPTRDELFNKSSIDKVMAVLANPVLDIVTDVIKFCYSSGLSIKNVAELGLTEDVGFVSHIYNKGRTDAYFIPGEMTRRSRKLLGPVFGDVSDELQ
jgi:hypothetical protein